MTASEDRPARAKKTADESLARLLSGRADRYAHETAAPLYDLGDALFTASREGEGDDVDLAHVFDFYASIEETHYMLLAETEPLVDADPQVFDAISHGTDAVVLLAIVARELHDENDDVLRHRIDAARCALDRADALLDELEDDLGGDA